MDSLLDKPNQHLDWTVNRSRHQVKRHHREGIPVVVFTTTNKLGHAFKIMNESNDLSLLQVHQLFTLFTSDNQEQEINSKHVKPKVFNLKTKRTTIRWFKYTVVWNTWESCGSNALTGLIRFRVPPLRAC
jgi:hypothetical protein